MLFRHFIFQRAGAGAACRGRYAVRPQLRYTLSLRDMHAALARRHAAARMRHATSDATRFRSARFCHSRRATAPHAGAVIAAAPHNAPLRCRASAADRAQRRASFRQIDAMPPLLLRILRLPLLPHTPVIFHISPCAPTCRQLSPCYAMIRCRHADRLAC
jgi:hypothetical protein